MKLEELMNLSPQEINSLTDKEMRSALSDIRSIARKRVDRLEKAGFTDSNIALKNLKSVGGLEPIRTIDPELIRRQFYSTRNFLRSPLSSVSKTKKLFNNPELIAQENKNVKSYSVYDAYNRYIELYGSSSADASTVFDRLYDELKNNGNDITKAIEKVSRELEDEYTRKTTETPEDTQDYSYFSEGNND